MTFFKDNGFSWKVISSADSSCTTWTWWSPSRQRRSPSRREFREWVTTKQRIRNYSGIRLRFTCVCHIVMFCTSTVIVGCVLPHQMQHSASPLTVSRNVVIGQDVDPWFLRISLGQSCGCYRVQKESPRPFIGWFSYSLTESPDTHVRMMCYTSCDTCVTHTSVSPRNRNWLFSVGRSIPSSSVRQVVGLVSIWDRGNWVNIKSRQRCSWRLRLCFL